MPKADLKRFEQEAWEKLLLQIDESFENGKMKPEEVLNLAACIKEYKTCHSKRFDIENKEKH